MKNIDESRNYFLKEIEENELMSEKHKKVCAALSYTETLSSTIAGCTSIFYFPSLTGISIGITSSAVGLKTCAITAGIKKYKSIIKKKKKKRDKIILLTKSKLNSIEVLISKALISSTISYDEFVSLNVLKEYDDMIKKWKNLKDFNSSMKILVYL